MNDFNSWNELKQKIDEIAIVPSAFPKESEVWMVTLGKNIGFEQNGSGEKFSRPVIVVRKFNNHMFWVVPLSTKQKSFDFYYNYTDPNKLKVSAILAQLKLISIKRFKRKLYEFDSVSFDSLKAKLKAFL